MFFLIYWILCGLVLFTLTNPTVYILTFSKDVIKEFIGSMILGGIVIPLLLIAVVIQLFRR